MKITYFDDKTWSEITRDERYFCFELYNCIKQNQKPFLELLYQGIRNESFEINGKSIQKLKNVLKTNASLMLELKFAFIERFRIL